jgi:hypothetical protein
VGALRTSEQADDVVGGEAKQLRSDDARSIDAPGQIIIDSSASGPTSPPARGRTTGHLPTAPIRSRGPGLVIIVYVLATAALGAAIYERLFL